MASIIKVIMLFMAFLSLMGVASAIPTNLVASNATDNGIDTITDSAFSCSLFSQVCPLRGSSHPGPPSLGPVRQTLPEQNF